MKTKDLLLLESYIEEIQLKENVKVNLNAINRLLQRLFDSKFTCSIIEHNPMSNDEFFGAYVYPSKDVINQIINSILEEGSKSVSVVELWKKCDEWTIEIDGALLYDNHLKASPAEVVAVLLHEIGHTVYANTIPQRLYKSIKMSTVKLTFRIKQICKIPKVSKIFQIPVLGACQSKNFRYVYDRPEMEADKLVVKMGYGEELNSFITKLVACSNNRIVNRTEKDVDYDVNTIVNWTVENISALEIRKTKLKQTLKTQADTTNSSMLKACYNDIMDEFVRDDVENFELNLMKEAYFFERSCNSVVEEGLKEFFDKFGKVKKIKPMEIDVIRIEIQKIKKIDDKFFVLDEIYSILNRIDVALQYIEEGKSNKCAQSKETYLAFQKELFEMRDQVLNMEIPETQYGVFVKMPKGYEG